MTSVAKIDTHCLYCLTPFSEDIIPTIAQTAALHVSATRQPDDPFSVHVHFIICTGCYRASLVKNYFDANVNLVKTQVLQLSQDRLSFELSSYNMDTVLPSTLVYVIEHVPHPNRRSILN